MHEAACAFVGGKAVHWQTSRKPAGSGGPQKQQDNLLQTCLGLNSRWITHMTILQGVALSWQAVAKHLWQTEREQGKKKNRGREDHHQNGFIGKCLLQDNYREAGASETPVFTNCLAHHDKLSISRPAVLHQNSQSLFFDILSICCSCVITDMSYEI